MVATLLIAAAAVGGGVWHVRVTQAPRLVWPGDGGFGIALPSSGKPGAWSFGGVALCLDRPGRVVIDRLVPLGGNAGLRVVDVATRPHIGKPAGQADLSFGSSQRDLGAEGFSPTRPAVVQAVCPPSWTTPYPGRVIYDELGVRLQRTVSGNGEFSSLRVEYSSGSRHGRLTIRWALRLCGPTATTAATCGSV
jgi:hypothetical protein